MASAATQAAPRRAAGAPPGSDTAEESTATAASSSKKWESQKSQRALQHQQIVTHKQQVELQKFWSEENIHAAGLNVAEKDFDWKQELGLPLARVKKSMRQYEGVDGSERKMISGEAPVLLGKACELFISELSKRGWMTTESTNRRTLQRTDIASAVVQTQQYDFLIDMLPEEELKQQTDIFPGAGGVYAIDTTYTMWQQRMMQVKAMLAQGKTLLGRDTAQERRSGGGQRGPSAAADSSSHQAWSSRQREIDGMLDNLASSGSVISSSTSHPLAFI